MSSGLDAGLFKNVCRMIDQPVLSQATRFSLVIVVLSLTLFYTCGLGIVVSHVMVPLPYRFSLGFFT
jgi:hypothetical protein